MKNKTTKEEKVPFYTNSSQLPVGATDDLFEALELQEPMQTKYTGGCIEEGNLVQTDKGLLPIEKICKDFERLSPLMVLSYNKEEEMSEWDEVIEAMGVNVEQKDRIRIKAERGLDITTSNWHPFFVLDGEEVIEKRADELEKNDYLLQTFTPVDIECSDESKLPYLIGYFIGNGSISKIIDNRGGNNIEKYLIRFTDGRKEKLEKIKRILNEKFKTKINKIQKDKRGKCLILATSSKKVADYLFNLGFESGSKTYIVRIPDAILRQVDRYGYKILSGLIDSDGYVDKWGNMEYSTVSPYLAHDIKDILNRMGIQFSCIKKESVRNNEKPIYRITISNGQMTDIKDKLTIVDNFALLRIKEKKSGRLKRHLPVVRVKEVITDNVGKKSFYDLTTKNNHNYLAGKNAFVFIHNTVFHTFLGERITAAAAKLVIKRAFKKSAMPYMSITPTFSVCPEHGYMSGEHFECPDCGKECEVYSRVVGYLRPIKQWNKGKVSEYKARKNFKI